MACQNWKSQLIYHEKERGKALETCLADFPCSPVVEKSSRRREALRSLQLFVGEVVLPTTENNRIEIEVR